MLNARQIIERSKLEQPFEVESQFGHFKVLYPNRYNISDLLIYVSVIPRISIGIGNISAMWRNPENSELRFVVSKFASVKQGIQQESTLHITQAQIIGKLRRCH